MATYPTHARMDSRSSGFGTLFHKLINQRTLERKSIFGIIIVVALGAFELFNYGTTEFALADLLGDLGFAGVRWASILALAFCSMDFAGIARLFAPDRGNRDQAAIWYLIGAWFLAGTMNAILTWWSVSLALIEHQGLGNEVIGREALLSTVPLFVAVLVWLIRVLIIGTFTFTGEALFTRANFHLPLFIRQPRKAQGSRGVGYNHPRTPTRQPGKPAPKPNPVPRRDSGFERQPLAAKAPQHR